MKRLLAISALLTLSTASLAHPTGEVAVTNATQCVVTSIEPYVTLAPSGGTQKPVCVWDVPSSLSNNEQSQGCPDGKTIIKPGYTKNVQIRNSNDDLHGLHAVYLNDDYHDSQGNEVPSIVVTWPADSHGPSAVLAPIGGYRGTCKYD